MRCKICTATSQALDADNWKKWQICFSCATEITDHYITKRRHGTGGTYIKPLVVKSMHE